MTDHPHPGRYHGTRSDFAALSAYWAARSRHYEAEADRLRAALEQIVAVCDDLLPTSGREDAGPLVEQIATAALAPASTDSREED